MKEYKYTHPDFTQKKFRDAPECRFEKAPCDGVAPQNFHAMSIYPEYFKVSGEWLLAEESRMDCVPVLRDGRIEVVEFRNLMKNDMVAIGRTEDCEDGIYLYPYGFTGGEAVQKDVFAFRTSRTRETAFSVDYDELYEILRHDRDNGKIVWVMGPAFSFDHDARKAFAGIINKGYVHALLAGNALATHDLEGAYLDTALGQNIYTQESVHNGHYNHLETINRVRYRGSIREFLKEEGLSGGIMAACEKNNVPYVLAGSIRDDGPLPEVCGDVYQAQDRMRAEVRGATTVICMATMLHSIAVGNMTPSYRVMKDGTVRPVFFYCVDISEFTINKLADRGSLGAKGIVTNVQDFIVNLSKALGAWDETEPDRTEKLR